jgi:hypothetical protein
VERPGDEEQWPAAVMVRWRDGSCVKKEGLGRETLRWRMHEVLGASFYNGEGRRGEVSRRRPASKWCSSGQCFERGGDEGVGLRINQHHVQNKTDRMRHS